MKNLLDSVRNRTKELSKNNSNKFNTNDFIHELLMNKKMKRSDVIDHIIVERLKRSNIKEEEISNEIIDKFYKTSKNGLDTSVSDSKNNSSYSFNERFKDFKLIKDGQMLEIKKIK